MAGDDGKIDGEERGAAAPVGVIVDATAAPGVAADNAAAGGDARCRELKLRLLSRIDFRCEGDIEGLAFAFTPLLLPPLLLLLLSTTKVDGDGFCRLLEILLLLRGCRLVVDEIDAAAFAVAAVVWNRGGSTRLGRGGGKYASASPAIVVAAVAMVATVGSIDLSTKMSELGSGVKRKKQTKKAGDEGISSRLLGCLVLVACETDAEVACWPSFSLPVHTWG